VPAQSSGRLIQVSPVSVLARSIAFNVLFYLNLFAHCIAAIPTLVMPRRALLGLVRFWARSNIWLLRVVCDIEVEYRGLAKIPPGALLVASKHQSLWETFALIPLFADPAFILKRELLWIPFFGWYAWKAGMIPVHRGKRSQALAALSVTASKELVHDRQIIIFPEGTRRAPGAEPSYKYGVVHLYAETGVACLPIALNSGLYWPRRSFRRLPGTVIVEVLDPIAPGLDKQEFSDRLRQTIETATGRLVAEGVQELTKSANAGGKPHRKPIAEMPGDHRVPPSGTERSGP
jgi:1-acyl-sn-glycerol-3-phosphate acyltransferase